MGMPMHIISVKYIECYSIKQENKNFTVLFPSKTILNMKNMRESCQI